MSEYIPNAFRLEERKYKYYKNPKISYDYSHVIDFNNINNNIEINKDKIIKQKTKYKGQDINIYSLRDINGFYYIPNILSIEEQIYWSIKSLIKYPDNPNYSNLGLLNENIWNKNLLEDKSDLSSSILYKLRWITLGYHYNWTTKIYENINNRITTFPKEIVKLTKEHANLCGFSSYKAQAGIINYYHANKSMIKAHQDKSEFTFNEPILSYSIGCSCIFLLGNISTDISPIPIWMRSGDLMIMGGNSRVFYHGVPRVFPNTTPSNLINLLYEQSTISNNYNKIADYLLNTRINMNIRTVFPKSQKNIFLSNEERNELFVNAINRCK